MDYCKHYAKEVIFPSAVKVPLHLLNLIFARVGTVMSVCVCVCMQVCVDACCTLLTVCVCVAWWEVGGRTVMSCEEVAGLSGQTGGNKEEPKQEGVAPPAPARPLQTLKFDQL